MFDLTEILLTNTKIAESLPVFASADTVSEESVQTSDFLLVMDDCLFDEEKSLENETLVEETKDENMPEEAKDAALVLPEQKPPHALDAPIILENNPQMAWFIASSFEPPEPLDELSQKEALPESINLALPNKLALPEKKQSEILENSSNLEDNSKNSEMLPLATEEELPSSLNEMVTKAWKQELGLEKAETNLNSNVEILTLPQQPKSPSPVTKQDAKMAEANIATSVHDSEWGNAFRQQILWLGHQKINSAKITLNPQELGHLEINIKMTDEKTSLDINTQSLHVKELIEQNIPVLKESMGKQGVNLIEVSVESQDQQHKKQPPIEREVLSEPLNEEDAVDYKMHVIKKNHGLVDYFA